MNLRAAVTGLFLLVAVPAASALTFLTDDHGGFLLDNSCGRLVSPDPVHTLTNLSTWGVSPHRSTVTIIVDVKADLSGIAVGGTACQEGAKVSQTWLYVQNKLVATCAQWFCDVEVPKAQMDAGLNNVLVAFTASDGISRGTSVFVSKP